MILWINCPIICNHSIPNCPVEFINIRKKDIIKHNNTFLAFISYCNQTDVVLPRKQSSQVDGIKLWKREKKIFQNDMWPSVDEYGGAPLLVRKSTVLFGTVFYA